MVPGRPFDGYATARALMAEAIGEQLDAQLTALYTQERGGHGHMNPDTGEIKQFEHEQDVPGGFIKLPHPPYKNCHRCFGRGHVGRVNGKYKPCPKCYSPQNKELWAQRSAGGASPEEPNHTSGTGYKGRVNAYRCEKCQQFAVTIDRDEGVTPFMLICRATEGCGGYSYSCFYQPPQGLGEPTHEWYKPTEAEMKKLDAGELDHVQRGGLLIRPIVAEASP